MASHYMHETPFDIVSCCWPRPVEQREELWVSAPEWDAPRMTQLPQPRWERLGGETCWTINWTEFFRSGLKCYTSEMRGFHVVFEVRVGNSGKLIFWDDDGSIVRRREEIIHEDREAHPLSRHELAVRAGEHLQIAHWQLHRDWKWGAQLVPKGDEVSIASELFEPYLERVERRLEHPTGPPLKLYFSGRTPVRTLLSVYSMLLNGYSPSEVLIFGEEQWPDKSRQFFKQFLPFAQVTPVGEVFRRLEELGAHALIAMARQHWFVMKACICLLYPPYEFCFLDDDVFILERLDVALSAFREADFVYSPDTNHGQEYLRLWKNWTAVGDTLRTGTFNAGLYLLRHSQDARKLAARMMRVSPNKIPAWLWEQGFIACQFSGSKSRELPSQQYFYPLFDGMPGGIMSYDYSCNPCGFVSIHFGGLPHKPSDSAALALLDEILGRSAPSYLNEDA